MADVATKKTNLIRLVMVVLGACGLFSAGLVGTLAVRGQLNEAYLGPLVGREVPEPTLDELHERMASERAELPVAAARSDLLPPVSLPSPFSGDETRALFDELLRTREELRERLARVEREKKDLELVRTDLNHRWDELNRREQEMEELHRSLDGERANLAAQQTEIDKRSTSLDQEQMKNIELLAAQIEKMTAADAAKLLMEKEMAQAALILSFIKAREAGKILAEMPPKHAAELTDRMLGVLKPGAGAASGGN